MEGRYRIAAANHSACQKVILEMRVQELKINESILEMRVQKIHVSNHAR